MQLYFIRHAQSENNLLWLETQSAVGRKADPMLTAVGHQQAQHLAHFLAQTTSSPNGHTPDSLNRHGFGLTHLYCSLMVRTIQTGMYVAQACQLPLMALSNLHEVTGIYLDDETTGQPIGLPGPNRAEFLAQFPDLILPDEVGEEGWWNRPPEPRDETMNRAQAVLASILQKHGSTEDRVALISHGGFYQRFMTAVYNLPPEHLHHHSAYRYRFTIHNTAITRFEFGSDFTGLAYQNRVDFLPPELVTP
ncbi:MAG: histidine phosphatase family protein [Ardenticatenaceae bacterium]|nr:histidine phosphatase family protein [Ardenticatenaceae bacterium]